jgi:2,4-dienoyl-CoA reductase-like NADH-dependent reductase (Old Yellow Enzyme family)
MRQKKHSFICIKIISLILSLIILNLKIKFENAKLFDKYILNNKVQVPGLLTIAPLTLLGSNSDGSISSEERNYLNQRAKNIGLYILGATAVSQEGISFPNMPRALNDNDIPSLSERAKIIKDQGALAINQLFHGGSLADSKYSGTNVIAVSSDMYNKGLTKTLKNLIHYLIILIICFLLYFLLFKNFN